jgi:hypothetical protein
MAQFAGRAYVEMGVEGQAAFRRAFASMEAQIKKFSAQVQMVGRVGFGAIGNSLNMLSRMMRSLIGQATALGAAFGISVGITDAIRNASTLEETLNKFNVVFGQNARSMQAWGDQFAATMGRSRSEVLGFMADAQSLVIPMGVDPAAAAEMSRNLTQLSYDLASFHNAADVDAFEALRSAIVGESEPMKRFGVIVNETAMKAELLKQGLDPQTANDAQKAMARYNIILAGTAQAQGDVDRSSMSFANQLKALQAGWVEVSTAIGTAFLPYATMLIDMLKDLLVNLDLNATGVDNSARVFNLLGQTLAYVNTPLDIAIRAFHGLRAGLSFIIGMAASATDIFLGLFRVLVNNPLTRRTFGADVVQNIDNIAKEVQATVQRIRDENRDQMQTSLNELTNPDNLGQKALDQFRDQMSTLRSAYEAESKAQAANLADATEAQDLTAEGTSKAADKVRATFEQFSGIDLMKAAAPGAEAVREGAEDVSATARDATQQAVQLAQPQALEATSTAAFEKFRENAMNQQLVLERQQAAFLQKIAKALTNPAAAFVEFAL